MRYFCIWTLYYYFELIFLCLFLKTSSISTEYTLAFTIVQLLFF